MNKDIAIIGIGSRFPKARNLDELYNILKNKRDLVKDISEKRVNDTTLDSKEEFRKVGYIDDIDKFDYKYFNIALAEAEVIDPNQRLLLETVHEAIDNSGISIDDFDGSNTSVFVSVVIPEYYKLASEADDTMFAGNSPAFLAAKIARTYNLTGNCSMIDASCSSSLVALHFACNELIMGDVKQAVVCGINLNLFPYKNKEVDFAMWSSDDKSRAFSSTADGMSCGELVGCLILKPLEDAIRDKDNIHAVIKGIAVNNNANKSASSVAPDSISQSNVIESAWGKAGIIATDIGYIEAHGSGTQIGDCLEVEALTNAFNKHTDKKQFCPISTIKSNLGHGYTASGIAGIIRTILALKNKVIFPAIHVDELNPMIDFKNSAVYVNKEFKEWTVEVGQKRLAGVTSLGGSGTNCHVILQEAPEVDYLENNYIKSKYLITISAKSDKSLKANMQELLKKLLANDNDYRLENISYTLNKGRKHHKYRYSTISSSVSDLINKLSQYEESINEDDVDIKTKIIYIFPDYTYIDQKYIDDFIKISKSFEETYTLCKKHGNKTKEFESFAFQYSFYKLLESMGIQAENFLSFGIGKIITDLITGTISFKEAIDKVNAYKYTEINNLEQRVEKLIERETLGGKVCFINIGLESTLLKVMLQNTQNNKNVKLLYLTDKDDYEYAILKMIKELYLLKENIDFNKFCSNFNGRKIELPAYQFEKYRCWIRDTPLKHSKGEKDNNSSKSQLRIKEEASYIEKEIALIWEKILDIDYISINDNFFEVGGDSIKTTRIIRTLNKKFSIRLDFEDIYDYPTINKLASYIKQFLGTEEIVKSIWKDVLKAENIKSSDSFFDIGGHSLMANQVINRIMKEFNIDLNFENIYKYPTLGELSNWIDELLLNGVNSNVYDDIKLVELQEWYDVSSSQRRLWILSQTKDGSVAYNTPVACVLKGELKKVEMKIAINKLIERHESLRTIFGIVDGELKQKIVSFDDFKFNIEDIDFTNVNNAENIILEIIEKDMILPFNLEDGPLIKCKLFTINEDKSVFYINSHHIINDGWSIQVFLKELTIIYNSLIGNTEPALEQLKLQYKDYVNWQNKKLTGQKYSEDKQYWLNKLGGELPILDLQTDNIRPKIQTYNGDIVQFKINSNLTNGLRQLCKKNNSTLFTVLLAATNTLFYRYTGQTDIILGTPIAGRQHKDFENQIGLYINTLCLRTQFSEEDTFNELLANTKSIIIEAYQHQNFQFEKLVEHLNYKRDLSHSPIFDVSIVLQNTSFITKDNSTLKNIEMSSFINKKYTSIFDIGIEFEESDNEIMGNITYNVDLFYKKRIEKLIEHFINIVQSVVSNVDQCINEINMFSEDETNMLLNEFNDTYAEYPRDKTIHELFEEQVKRTPNNTAIVFEKEKLTYRELNEKANTLAKTLREKGVKSDSIVGIIVERSLEMMVGIIGILKAGGAYLPIDPEYPEERIRYMLKDSGTKILLTHQDNIQRIVFDGEIINLDDGAIFKQKEENLEIINTSKDLAYVIYTSGSTGKPKGVMIEHRSVINRLNWMQKKYPLNETDTILQKTTYTFDVSVWELFWGALEGAKVCMIQQGKEKEPKSIADEIKNNKVTVIHFVPSMFNVFMEHIERENEYSKVKALKQVFCSGEALGVHQVMSFNNTIKSRCGTELANLYGPTEATVDVTYFNCSKEENSRNVPIGKPIDNTKIYIINKEMKLQPIDVAGELCIGGEGVARGYLNNPELTAEKFIDNPFSLGERIYKTGDLAKWLPDGNIEYIGRIDHQVKIRGFRIELGEIESKLVNHESVKEAIVIDREETEGQKYLCAYIVTDKELTVGELRKHLTKNLPEYMIPAYFIQLEKIPLTSNGKVDRKALPEPDRNINLIALYKAPTNEIEEKLAEIWSGVLGVEKIGINDNFFELGGDSIKAIQIIARMNRYAYTFQMKDLFENPTIEGLSKHVKVSSIVIEQGIVEGDVELTPIQSWFFKQNFTEMHHWNQSTMLYNKSGFIEEIIRKVFDKIILHHDALRMVYKIEKGHVSQFNKGMNKKLYSLEVFDFTAIKEYQQNITKICNSIQGSLDLSTGPLVKLVLFKTDEGDHLLIVTHHLVIDGVSWRILFEDFTKGYIQAIKNEEIMFQEKTTSYRHWAQALREHASSKSVLKELEYWNKIEVANIKTIPKDHVVERSIAQNNQSKTVKLSKEKTELLLKNSNKVYNTEINDTLITALGITFKKWTNQDKILINLEGHGREEILEGVDITRTVGWFTIEYPVILDMSKSNDLSYSIKIIKEDIRHIPNRGFNYQVLKYLTKEDLKRNAKFILKPEISFNYLGQFDQDVLSEVFEISNISIGKNISASCENLYAIHISGLIANESLYVTFEYSKDEYEEETMENLIKNYEENLINIIDHCSNKTEIELTPSDLGDDELTFDELNDIMDDL